MDWTKYIRVTIGLSQPQMANFLGIAKSLVGHVENGKRSPSPKMVDKLMFLHRLIVEYNLAGTAQNSARLPRGDYSKPIKALKHRAEYCRLEAEQLKRKLDLLIDTYNECERVYPNIRLVEENLPDDSEKIMNMLWAEIWRDGLLARAETCGPDVQSDLRMRIDLLEAEVAAAKNEIGKLSLATQLSL